MLHEEPDVTNEDTEKKRKILDELVLKHGLNSDIVIKYSQELDPDFLALTKYITEINSKSN